MTIQHFTPEYSTPEGENDIKIYPHQSSKVYVFGTCLVDLFDPDTGMSGILLLEHAGVEVIYPQQQTCCGQPAYTSGYKEEARLVALHQMSLFKENIPILVPSGSCGGMMKLHYPRLFAGTEHEDTVNHFAARIYELTDFLANACDLTLDDRGEAISIALHTSCSSRREMKSTDSGKKLLSQLSNVDIYEPHKTSECCGFGGAFSVRHPSISNAMVTDKLKHLNDTKADTFVSTDCGCLMNIKGAADKSKSSLLLKSGQHLLHFVAQRAGLLSKEHH